MLIIKLLFKSQMSIIVWFQLLQCQDFGHLGSLSFTDTQVLDLDISICHIFYIITIKVNWPCSRFKVNIFGQNTDVPAIYDICTDPYSKSVLSNVNPQILS